MEDKLFHYTTMEALTKIMQKEKVCFLATHYKYLNDPSEYQWGLEQIKSKCADFNTDETDLFILSLSKQRDFLPMWSMYAQNGNGVMFEVSNLASLCFESSFSMTDCEYSLENIDLDSELKLCERYKNSDDKFIQKLGQSWMKMLPAIIKHPAYKYEDEARLIFNKLNNEEVIFRERKGILIPCVKRTFDKSFIKSITLGPILMEQKEKAKESLQMFLYQNKYGDLIDKIHFSSVPYKI